MITNKKLILQSNTCTKARKLVLDALEAGLLAADPKRIMKRSLKFDEDKNILRIRERAYDMNDFDNVYVVGAGKASGYMAEAANETLEDRITDGLVIVPERFATKLNTGEIKIWYGTHPIPSTKGEKGARKILDIVRGAGKEDLIICLISGGGSALMPLPYEGITISQKKVVTDQLLRSGATIKEVNTVRKHLSLIKGGRLAEAANGSTLLCLIISDVVGDDIDTVASGPTAPDSTTFRDAMQVLKKYGLWNGLDKEVKKVISDGVSGKVPDTPKPSSKHFRRVENFVIGNNKSACLSVMDYLTSKGVSSIVLTTFLEGEARTVGTVAASIAKQLNKSNEPLVRPAAIIVGGETTVTVKGKGKGGRNQEVVLSAAMGITELGPTVIASMGTDGIDGNSDDAGAIADSETLCRATAKKLDPLKFLNENDANSFFRKLNDVIHTGYTGTNVNDILAIVCL